MVTLKNTKEMNRVQKLALAALTALALAAGAAAAAPHSAAGVAKKGSFDITEVAKVNEYEGQHRVVAWSWGETQTGTGDGGGTKA